MGSGASQQKQQTQVANQILQDSMAVASPKSPPKSKTIDRKPAPKIVKDQKSQSNTSQLINRAYRSQGKRQIPDSINKSSTTLKKDGSSIRIKQSGRKSEYSIKNPEANKIQLQSTKQLVEDASQIIEMDELGKDSPAINKKAAALSQISRHEETMKQSTNKSKKKFDPKLSELIKLYGFT